MALALSLKILEHEEVVVIRCLEFPNIVVEGKNELEATNNFKKAFEYFLTVRNKIEIEQYPLAKNEKIQSLQMEFLTNE